MLVSLHKLYLRGEIPVELLQFYRKSLVVVLVLVVGLAFAACAQIEEMLPFDLSPSQSDQEPELVYVPMPEIPLAPGPVYHGEPREPQVMLPELGYEYLVEGYVTVNIGNVSRGYFKVRNESDAEALVKIMSYAHGEPDFFNLAGNNDWEVFPLTRGDGVYTIQVLEYYGDRVFKVVFSHDVYVNLENQNLPFLYPSRYVNFSVYSEAVAVASRLAGRAGSDLEIVQLVYDYITTNIDFDLEFAMAVYSGFVLEHIPNADATLAAGTGICFDFAVLMAAMLRSQNIPTRLEIGYVLGIFHAWVAVYVPGANWGYAAHPTAIGWGLLDPTTTSANNVSGFLNPVVDVNEYSILFVR